MLAESMKNWNTIMLRIVIVLAVVFISIENASGVNMVVGVGNPRKSNCTKMSSMKLNLLYLMRMSPKCDENGDLLPMQCFESSKHCMCVRKDGSMINKPASGLKGCQCMVTKDEEENSGLIGNYIPQCETDGSYSKKQCHYSTGYCYCVDPSTGKKMTKPSRKNISCD